MRFSDAFNFVHSQSSTLAWLGKASKDIQRSVFLVVFGVGQNQFELVDLHEADHVVVGDIGEDPVFVDVLDLHDSALLDEEEVLALGPSVFGGVAVNLALCQEVPVLLVKLGRESDLLGGILAFVQKEVVVLVLIINLLFEEILYFFEVGEGVDEGYFILLGVIVDLVVV